MTRKMDLLGIPSLPLKAFVNDGSGRIKPQGKGGGSAPKAPDYTAAAEKTAQGDLDLAKYTTQANRINQYTPWGSLTYTNDRQFDQAGYDAAMAAYGRQAQQQSQPSGGGYVMVYDGTGSDNDYGRMVPYGGGQQSGGSFLSRVKGANSLAAPNRDDFYSSDNWQQHMQLAPELQAQLEQQWALQAGLFDPQNAALGRVQDMMANGFDMSGIGEGGQVYDPNLATNNATELLMERINPQLDRQREALRAQMANQGIAQGSSAYNNAMDQWGQNSNDAYNQAALQGIGLGMQQQGMQFGQSEQQRQRQMQEQAYLRGLPLQELQALMGGGQVQMPNFPGYSQQGQTAGADYLGAAGQQYQGDLGSWNAQQAQQQQMSQGLGGLGGALGSMFGGPMGGLLGSAGGSILGGLFG